MKEKGKNQIKIILHDLASLKNTKKIFSTFRMHYGSNNKFIKVMRTWPKS